MQHLSQNHTEYWKAVERINVFGEPYTRGFHWYETFHTSKRLRWPIGRAMESPLPWVCTRKELMRGELKEEGNAAKYSDTLERILMSHWGGFRAMVMNKRQGWLPNGMEIKGE